MYTALTLFATETQRKCVSLALPRPVYSVGCKNLLETVLYFTFFGTHHTQLTLSKLQCAKQRYNEEWVGGGGHDGGKTKRGTREQRSTNQPIHSKAPKAPSAWDGGDMQTRGFSTSASPTAQTTAHDTPAVLQEATHGGCSEGRRR
jgi:hypothetical protein